ncbi:MAG: dihydroorotate dehydrogenase [Planctomycetes bacterium]|nr:dihydroorotate dehydrogenase [Planctomycetota bacterium]
MATDLSADLGKFKLHNPLMTASGTAGYGAELSRYVDVNSFGALVGKSISKEPRKGNPYQRTVETPSGMLNAIGLQNEGWESFTKKTLPMMRELCQGKKTQIVVNIVGHDLDEYVWLAERVNDQAEVAAVELNLSCPNVSGGMKFSTTPEGCEELVAKVRKVLDLPLIAKLSPNVVSVAEIAQAAERGGADCLSLINTLVGMALDWRTRKPVIANVTGGLSGPAVKPVALRCVWQAAQAVKLPVIGIGGICNADDVLEFVVAGASAVQLGTMLFVEPDLSSRVLEELRTKVREAGVESLRELVGTLSR